MASRTPALDALAGIATPTRTPALDALGGPAGRAIGPWRPSGEPYAGAPDLPLERDPFSPLDLLTFFGLGRPGMALAERAAAPLVGRLAPALRPAAAAVTRGAVSGAAFAPPVELAAGRQPLPAVPGYAAGGAVLGPALEAVHPLARYLGSRALAALSGLRQRQLRPAVLGLPPAELPPGPPSLVPAGAPLPAREGLPLPERIPVTARAATAAETGGPAERVFRPEKLGLPPELGPAERQVVSTFEALGLDTRQVRSFEDMRRGAAAFGWDADALLAGAAKRPLADVEVVGLRNLLARESAFAQEAGTTLARPGLTDVERQAAEAIAEGAHQRIVQGLKRLSVGGTETGRAVAAFRIIANRTLDPAYWYLSAERQLRGRPFTPEIRQAIDDLLAQQDRVGLSRLMASLHQSTRTEKAIALWKAGMLSNPATDVANISGNVFMSAMESLKDVPATAFDALASVATGQRTKALSPIVLAEKLKGFPAGARKAGEVLRQGDLMDDLLSKYDYNRGTRFDTPALQFYTQAVFRRLGAEDALFREPALRGSVAEQAVIIARNEGLKGLAFLERVRGLIQSPTPRMLDIGRAASQYATFQQPSNIASWLNQARGGMRVGVEAIAPFRRTPLNIATTIVDYSPFGMPKAVIGGLNRAGADRYLGQKYFVETLGRSVTGTTLAGLGWALAKAGLAVGLPPKDEEERNNRKAQRIPNNALRIGGNWVTLDRLSPASNILLLGVNAAEQFERQPDLAGKLAGTGFSVLATLREQTFLKGLAGVGKAVDNPEQFGGNFLEQLAGSLVPSLAGAVARGTEPIQRRQEGLVQGVQARIPGARGMLAPVVDVRGREVRAPKGLVASLLSPVTRIPADTSAIARAFAASGYGPAMPQAVLRRGERKVALTGFERARFERESGLALERAIARGAAQPRFFALDDVTQKEILSRLAGKARAQVRRKWTSEAFKPSSTRQVSRAQPGAVQPRRTER